MWSRKPYQTPPNMTLPPNAPQEGLMFSTSEGVDQGGHFATSQNAFSFQKVSFVNAFASPTVQNISLLHHTPLVYTYATAPLVTQTQGLYCLDANYCVETKNDPRIYINKIVNRNLKALDDTIRSLRGHEGYQSVMYEDLYAFSKVELPPVYKIPKFKRFDGSGNPFFHLKTYVKS